MNVCGGELLLTDLPDSILTAVREYIQHPVKMLKTTIRAAIRSHQTIAPIAATTNRGLALDVLTTNRGNVLCPHHQEMDKRDSGQDAKHPVNGVPLPRLVAETKKEAKTEEFQQRLNMGFLHCGCPMNAALWDFYFWKSLTLTQNSIDGEAVTEHVPRWTPRERAFILKIFEEYTFLTVDDLYTQNMSPERHKQTMLTSQVLRIMARLNELREKLGMGKLKLVDRADSESEEDVDSSLD